METYPLIAENIKTGYNGILVLKGVSFTLAEGEKCVLTGSNGTGKTTLLKTILGLHSFAEGNIQLFGFSPAESRKASIRRKCAYVNQLSVQASLPVSAGEIAGMGLAGIRIGRREAELRITEALESTGIANLRHRPYNELSGGQKQRTQISRCLVQGADLFFLDEPLASLDPDSKESIVLLLSRLPQTILAVSHEHDHFRKWNWVFRVMEEGMLR